MRSQTLSSRVFQLLAFGLGLAVAGCGGNSTPVCKLTSINVSPASGVADHTVAAPGNM
jgi:hypothetical protein